MIVLARVVKKFGSSNIRLPQISRERWHTHQSRVRAPANQIRINPFTKHRIWSDQMNAGNADIDALISTAQYNAEPMPPQISAFLEGITGHLLYESSCSYSGQC
jgi:hypothetical protein